jgi:hypothetical protein
MGGFAVMAMAASLFLAHSAKAQDVNADIMTIVQGAQNSEDPATAKPTPHTPDGHPNLSGMWRERGAGNRKGSLYSTVKKDENGNVVGTLASSRRCVPNQKGPDGVGCREWTNETIDFELIDREEDNRPLYKPEFWAKVQDLDYNTNQVDPLFTCDPLGVPREGAPGQILQSDGYESFFYSRLGDHFRIIPTDNRAHDPQRSQDISFFGDSVAHWEGDMLVVDAKGFTDSTWLAGGLYGHAGGYFHSYNMHVIERFYRRGDVLYYQATVDDPDVLLMPWRMDLRVLDISSDPKAYMHESDLCKQTDSDRAVIKVRH